MILEPAVRSAPWPNEWQDCVGYLLDHVLKRHQMTSPLARESLGVIALALVQL